ncbi:9466_t:CDS:10 [Paraglomus occultum]|uniref:9466_t:CDS:1 n=1 Tax=Paraglomus occultum TaxID=144539 RepID=A0A9N9EYS2_9GLOM|nr:9466_t:CDS:10 [Paraglomus occultum]
MTSWHDSGLRILKVENRFCPQSSLSPLIVLHMASTEAQVATLLTIASDAHAQPKQRLEALNAFEQLVEGRGDLVEHQTTVALSFVSVPNPDIQKWAVGFIECRSGIDAVQHWDTMKKIKEKITSFLEMPDTNYGIKTRVVKFLQTIVIVQSRHVKDSMVGSNIEIHTKRYEDISLSLCPPSHPFLDPTELEQEAISILNALMMLLRRESSSTITAIVNAMGPLLRTRPQYIQSIANAFATWNNVPSDHLTDDQIRSILKCMRIQLISFLRAFPYSTFAFVFDILLELGGRQEITIIPKQFRTLLAQRDSIEEVSRNNLKRTGVYNGESSKRPRLDENNGIGSSAADALSQFDVTQFPLLLVVEVILVTLQNISLDRLRQAIMLPTTAPSRIQSQVNTKRQAPRRDARLRDPRLRASRVDSLSSASAEVDNLTVKIEPMDTEDLKQSFIEQETPDQQNNAVAIESKIQHSDEPIPSSMSPGESESQPSTPERPMLTFRIQPFTLPQPVSLVPSQCRSLMRMRLSKIFDAEEVLSDKMEDAQSGSSAPIVGYSMTKSQWMIIVSRLLTRGLSTDWEYSWRLREMDNERDVKMSDSSEANEEREGSETNNDEEDKETIKNIEEEKENSENVEDVEEDIENLRNEDNEKSEESTLKDDSMSIVEKKEPECIYTSRDDEPNDAAMIEEENVEREMRSNELREIMVRYILENFEERMELALTWLYEEWYHDEIMRQAIPNYSPNYPIWFRRLLDSVMPLLERKDKAFTKFLLDAPELLEDIVDRIKIYCNDPDRMQLGFSTLQDLINLRPPTRSFCLKILLLYCIHNDKITRSSAIITVKRWVPDHPQVASEVEAFAKESLNALRNESSPQLYDYHYHAGNQATNVEVTIEGEESAKRPEDVKWTDADALRHMELFFGLCSKKHELLTELFSVYTDAAPKIQKIILKNIQPLIKYIGMNSPKLLNIIKNFPQGSETLVLRILIILTDSTRPTSRLVSIVKTLFMQKRLDARCLIPIISGLEKDEILRNLPKMLELLVNTEKEHKPVKELFSRILSAPPTNASNAPSNATKPSISTSNAHATSAPLTPQELLVALHQMEDSVELKKSREAIRICFSMTNIFTEKTIAGSLQQMADQTTLPTLFMYTVIQAVAKYPNLAKYVNNILPLQMTKKIWTNSILWKGFIKYCTDNQPSSFNVLLQLPKEKLEDVLNQEASLKLPLKLYVEQTWNETQKRNRMPYLAGLLEING